MGQLLCCGRLGSTVLLLAGDRLKYFSIQLAENSYGFTAIHVHVHACTCICIRKYTCTCTCAHLETMTYELAAETRAMETEVRSEGKQPTPHETKHSIPQQPNAPSCLSTHPPTVDRKFSTVETFFCQIFALKYFRCFSTPTKINTTKF